jgi:TatD DNase family protein
MNKVERLEFIDSHMHLLDRRFAGVREAVLAQAQEAGVTKLFCNATCEDDWLEILTVSAHFPAVVPYLGIHPWFGDRVRSGWGKRLEELVIAHRCGIGETGLDRKCPVDMKIQLELFTTQLQLAADYRRPLVVHCLDCWGKLLEVLEQRKKEGLLPLTMIHSFNGSVETMRRLVRLGCFISFSMNLLDPEREKLRNALQETPIAHLLLETDAPDQLPTSRKIVGSGDQACNEPANIPELYRLAANLHHTDLQDFCRQIKQNGTLFTDSTLPR